MRKSLLLLMAPVLVFALVGCDKADKAIEGINKAKEFVDTTEKKVAEGKKEFDKTIEKIVGENKKGAEEKEEQERKEKDD
ncbi:MAG: hypothetical protein HGA78_12035 [Nitrospirales bacterium]|nr:hypothetical protein [Nitrospirales bacterium]